MRNHRQFPRPDQGESLRLHAAIIMAASAATFVVLVGIFRVPSHEWAVGLTWIAAHIAIHETLKRG